MYHIICCTLGLLHSVLNDRGSLDILLLLAFSL